MARPPRTRARRWLLGCVVIAACSQRHEPPAATAVPMRIVALSPAATELLFAVGCGGHIVLRDQASDFPAAVTPIAAIDGLQPSIEPIHAARPQMVLGHYLPPALQAHLRSQGVTWHMLAPDTLQDVAADIRQVGSWCGQSQQGVAAARRFEAEIAAIRRATATLEHPTVYLEVDATDPQRPYAAGGMGFGHELLLAAGGRNVLAAHRQAWFAVAAEAVIAADPEVIVLADADGTDRPQTAGSVAARPGWSALRAVRNGRIVTVSADLVSRPGPRLAAGVAAMAAALHPSRSGSLTAEAPP